MAVDRKVLSMRGKVLFPTYANRYAFVLQAADSPTADGYASLIQCELCEGLGKISYGGDKSTIVHCPKCNGFGSILRLLRADQVNAPIPPPPPKDRPTINA